jgi:ATP-binding cassette subfamily B (MDR/TAP) protein 1
MDKAKHAAREFKRLFNGENMQSKSATQCQTPQPDMRGLIAFLDVSFRYPSRMDQPILRRLNLTVKPGQFVALAGASGSGKSTIISLLKRFYNPMTGGIYIDGRNAAT